MLKEQLQEDLKRAMFAKDQTSLDTIRALKTAIMKFETSGKNEEVTDQVIVDLAMKEVKQRKDSIEQFQKGGREDLAKKEMQELEILQKYIPAQMSEEDIKTFVKEAIAQTGASSMQDLGKVMGALMPKVKGKADGALVNKIVKEMLA